jgi:hypothetical protein
MRLIKARSEKSIRRPERVHRPELESLEDRMVRGDTVLGALAAHVWLEPNLLAAADDGAASPGRSLRVLATARPLAAAPWFPPAAAEQTSVPAVAGRPVVGARQDWLAPGPEDDGTALGSFPFAGDSALPALLHGLAAPTLPNRGASLNQLPATGFGEAVPSSALLPKVFHDQKGKLGPLVLQASQQDSTHAAPAVDVQVSNAGASSPITAADQSTYTAPPAPVVTEVGARAGTAAGGYAVHRTGTSFTGTTAVWFGGAEGAGSVLSANTALRGTAPAHAAGVAEVHMTARGGTSGLTTADSFHYVTTALGTGPLAMNGIGLTASSTLGGTSAYLSWSNLSGATAISFGGTAGTSQLRSFDTAPAQSARVVDVQVSSAGGTSAIGSTDQFSPIITAAPSLPASPSTTGRARTRVSAPPRRSRSPFWRTLLASPLCRSATPVAPRRPRPRTSSLTPCCRCP